jgi:hypothetical protein
MGKVQKLCNSTCNTHAPSLESYNAENNLHPFTEPEGPCSQQQATGPYPKPDESRPQTHTPIVRYETIAEAKVDRIFLGYQPCQLVKKLPTLDPDDGDRYGP